MKDDDLEYIDNAHHKMQFIKKCECCGKEFDIFPSSIVNWCYKIHKQTKGDNTYIMFCSWSCQVKWESAFPSLVPSYNNWAQPRKERVHYRKGLK